MKKAKKLSLIDTSFLSQIYKAAYKAVMQEHFSNLNLNK